jgi:hypothetical protein
MCVSEWLVPIAGDPVGGGSKTDNLFNPCRFGVPSLAFKGL